MIRMSLDAFDQYPLLARLVGEGRVYAYRFGGKSGRVSQDRYFGDLGDVDAYFRANLELLEPTPGCGPHGAEVWRGEWCELRSFDGARVRPGKHHRQNHAGCAP